MACQTASMVAAKEVPGSPVTGELMPDPSVVDRDRQRRKQLEAVVHPCSASIPSERFKHGQLGQQLKGHPLVPVPPHWLWHATALRQEPRAIPPNAGSRQRRAMQRLDYGKARPLDRNHPKGLLDRCAR